MNFLVDAHLPRHLALLLREHGYDAIHTLDLPEGNRTTDKRINEILSRTGFANPSATFLLCYVN
jgi:predicted nuclease of predicted toxin-antitoxin system